MKKTLFLLFTCFQLFPAATIAQCTLCSGFNSPQEGTTTYLLGSDWIFGDIHGQFGQQYISFEATFGNKYVLTTLSQFGGEVVGVSNKDVLLTVVSANPNLMGCYEPVPGVFGASHDDDLNYGDSRREPLLIWSPPQTGTYYIHVTAYPCVQLAPSQRVRVAYRSLYYENANFSLWTGACDDDWTNGCNWVTRGATGSPQVGRPTSFANYNLNILGNRPVKISSGIDTCKNIFFEGIASLALDGGVLRVQKELENYGNSAFDLSTWTFYTDYAEIYSQASNPGTLIFSNNQYSAHNLQGVKVKLSGHGSSYFGFVSDGNTTLHSLEVGAPIGWVVNQDLTITHQLTFNQAELSTPKTLKLGPSVQINNSGLFSFIQSGSRVEKTTNGNATFAIPLGNNGNRFRQIDITPSTSTQTKWRLTHENSQSLGTAVASGLHHVSSADLWTVELLSGPSQLTGTVKLYWSDCAGVGNNSLNSSDLRVAGWDSQLSKWVSLGNQLALINANSGHILSGTVDFRKYTKFTLASTTANHPLYSCYIGAKMAAEESTHFDLTLSPNPAHDQVTIAWDGNEEATSIAVFDLSGRRVLNPLPQQNQAYMKLSTASLSPGVYQVVMTFDKRRVGKKLVIQ